MLTALISGALLGLAAGLAPGPLLALVLAQSIRHGTREGCKIALSPLVTDPPIILVALALAANLARFELLLGIISVIGALFVLYLAWETLRPVQVGAGGTAEPPRSWMKGVATNLLSPHPWLFWLTVGAAVLASAMARSWLAAAAFLAGFYLLLVGSKLLIAILAGRSRNLLGGRPYRFIMRALALLLLVFALLLLREGLKHLAVV